jgi:hypothetical protein
MGVPLKRGLVTVPGCQSNIIFEGVPAEASEAATEAVGRLDSIGWVDFREVCVFAVPLPEPVSGELY